MTITLKKVACFAGLALMGLASASAQNLKPGQYEYATVTEVFGMKIPVNFKQCVTQKDVDTNSAVVFYNIVAVRILNLVVLPLPDFMRV